MEINNSQNLTTKFNSHSKVSFNGLRKLLDAKTVESFLKKTEVVGDVVIMRRVREGYRQKLIPVIVSLVRTKQRSKGDKESKIFFSLFEKGFDATKTVHGLDSKELGLMEVECKNLENLCITPDNTPIKKSGLAVKRAYDKALKVMYLASYEGDKYRGIGSKLLDCAVKFSNELGLKGKVFLHSLNQVPHDYLKASDYCKKMYTKMPTRFYYRYGFRADKATNSWLENEIDIDDITMYLPNKERIAILQRLRENPMFVN